ncbi:SPV147 hypothetical protein [Swinepox virus]|uniref:Uncharacterized protein C2 n=2 Tax=Swinepox virus TaxID=10276 RepID=VC02_SWPVK|nr:hypothetical protein SWPVgp004 [Swinepox virus]NP_570307.1 hypothetical protein SWPVgp147 [Swinepox virus]P32230.1 RecName: Full=Uncharacterized protein C2 [Swinepox virus (STRAIN KASZA)]AAC37869.1 ORF C2L [Swinepox virus]AAC37874.1 K3R [Swinepox virus]AAL69743.1 SPV004 hypothetical protein [Swinepox virus]AAL69886.1 SPV147 hypothetical protein [Swinepox virus]
MLSYIINPLLSIVYFILGNVSKLLTYILMKIMIFLLRAVNPYSLISNRGWLSLDSINPFKKEKRRESFLSSLNPFRKEETKKKEGFFSGWFG